MGNERMKLVISPGITMLIVYILLGTYHWNRAFGELSVIQLLVMVLAAYVIGLVVSGVLFALKISKDFNIASLALLAFFITLYLCVGDIRIDAIVIGWILISALVGTVVSFIVGFILYLMVR